MEFLLFIDEAGDHGLTTVDPSFPLFVLCGIIVSQDEYKKIELEMSAIKHRFWGDKRVILHSRDIRRCDNEFQILFDLTLKEQFYTSINNLVSSSDYTVITSVIDKSRHIQQYGKLASDVYEIALSFILERAIFWLDDQPSKPHSLSIYIEQRGKKEDNRLHEHFQRLQSRGTAYVTPDRIQSYCRHVEFKVKRDDICGLQLADLIAYPIARYVLDPERANPAFEVLSPKIYVKNGHRYGLKVFP